MPSSIKTDDGPVRLTAEVGRSGLIEYGGQVHSEYDPDLRGLRGLRIYDEMRRNDPTVALGLRVINWMIGQVNWSVQPGGTTPADQEAAEFLESCRGDMSHTWGKLIRDALTCLPFGFAWLEIVYKQRNGPMADPLSRYDDGRIAWRKFTLLGHDSWSRWLFDEAGGVKGFVQQEQMMGNYFAPELTVPIEKSVLFRLDDEKNNPDGQALALDTPIPTSDGWRTMGELQKGDKVYDETGRIRYVVAKSEVWEKRPCYRLTFTGGHSIIADENHVWSVTNANQRHRKAGSRLMTTKQIAESGPEYRRHLGFGVTPQLDGVRQALPIKPYVLGYWLGDGNSHTGEITAGAQDWEGATALFEREGYSVKVDERRTDGVKRLRLSGLNHQLHELAIAGNKRIPDEYLRAPIEDRRALLQGLMDSDGTAHKREHYPLKWVNANKVLVDQMDSLIRSLGGRPLTYVTKPTGRAKPPCPSGLQIVQRQEHSHITFYMKEPTFRLARKLNNQTNGHARSYQHYLKSIESVEPRDTVCIEVDSPTHLYLAGKGMVPTHNSLLRSIYDPWYKKKNLEEIEAIGIERDLTGVLIIHLPVNATTTDKSKAIQLLEQFKADDMAGFTAPQFGAGEHERWRFEIINSPGSKSIDPDKVIQRYQVVIARGFLLQFLMLGLSGTGSFALGKDQRDMFEVALGAILTNLDETINRFVVPPLFRFNDFGKLTALPRIVPGRISKADVEKLTKALMNLATGGLLTADAELEKYIRQEFDLPELVETESPAVPEEDTGDEEGLAKESSKKQRERGERYMFHLPGKHNQKTHSASGMPELGEWNGKDSSLSTVESLEDTGAVVSHYRSQGQGIYVRYSKGPQTDAKSNFLSKDWSSGKVHSGLSAEPLFDEAGIFADGAPRHTSGRIAEYSYMLGQGGKGTKAYILTGREVGRDTDNAPLIGDVKPIAFIGAKAIGQAEATAKMRRNAQDELRSIERRKGPFSNEYKQAEVRLEQVDWERAGSKKQREPKKGAEEDDDQIIELPDPNDDDLWERLERESNKRLGKPVKRTVNELFSFARKPYDYEGKIQERQTQFRTDMRNLAAQLREGQISQGQWQQRSKEKILVNTMDGYRLGVAQTQGLPLSKVKLTPAQRKQANAAIGEQYKYFADFAKTVKGKLDAGDELTSSVDARANLYGGSVRSAASQAQLDEQGDKRLTWVRYAGDSCETCLKYGGQVKKASEWRKLDVWPSHNVACHGNCRCGWSVAKE